MVIVVVVVVFVFVVIFVVFVVIVVVVVVFVVVVFVGELPLQLEAKLSFSHDIYSSTVQFLSNISNWPKYPSSVGPPICSLVTRVVSA